MWHISNPGSLLPHSHLPPYCREHLVQKCGCTSRNDKTSAACLAVRNSQGLDLQVRVLSGWTPRCRSHQLPLHCMSFDGGGEQRSAVSSDLNHQLIGFSDVELQVVQSTPLHILVPADTADYTELRKVLCGSTLKAVVWRGGHCEVSCVLHCCAHNFLCILSKIRQKLKMLQANWNCLINQMKRRWRFFKSILKQLFVLQQAAERSLQL